ncbi:MAG TPA: cell envelope integrity protein CreD [Usitatibacter sp.]|nr:cell envelope integrity protein CreD [Usitatibacter sp.]
MRLPLLARTLAIAAVAVAILVPIAMIDGKIAERRARADGVVSEFASQTSGPQLVVGPLLALTCEETYVAERQVMRSGKAETISETRTRACPTAFVAPRSLEANASVPVENLHRGIYSIRMYRADLTLQGELEWPRPPRPAGQAVRAWKDAYVVTFLQDPRGIKAVSSAISNELLAATGEPGLAAFSIRESLGPYAARGPGAVVPFLYRIDLVGTSSFAIAPVGDRNHIHIGSDWPHPSFAASWSPDRRAIGPRGFDADWRMTSVATGGSGRWNELAQGGKLASANAAGLSLFDPVNVYTLSYRATQYAFLFVLFTFAALALAEVLSGVRLHPVQYALVGSALAVFFLLLIALSEHVPFEWAYSGAAAACVALLTFYLRHPLGSPRRTALFFAIFVALYGSLYLVLQSEDDALLLGSLMVFALLAAIMVATRKLDWAAIGARLARGTRPTPPPAQRTAG